jgi:hypothetical protein
MCFASVWEVRTDAADHGLVCGKQGQQVFEV